LAGKYLRASILILFLSVSLAAMSSGFARVWVPAGKVVPGVTVCGIDLQGADRVSGTEKLLQLERELASAPVVLRCRGKEFTLSYREAGISLNTKAIMDRALAAGRRGTLFEQFKERMRLRNQEIEIPLLVDVDTEKMTAVLKAKAPGLYIAPRNAHFVVGTDNRVKIMPDRKGRRVDVEHAAMQIKEQLVQGKKPVVNLVLDEVKPDVTTADIKSMGLKGLLAEYTTKFDASQVNRSYNIRVAAEALNGLLVKPGEEVSFNKVVGPRSSEAGYKNADIIFNNKLVKGVGGGVCQVSSTLYNSVLLAGLKITDRTNHSLPVGYVPIGRDATVVYGYIDLKFRNNTGSYVYIKSEVREVQRQVISDSKEAKDAAGDARETEKVGFLTFKIYGNTDNKRKVLIKSEIVEELEPETIYEEDPNLPEGEQVVKQSGSKGYKVRTERLIVEEQIVVKREALPGSLYQPVDKIIAVGQKPPALEDITVNFHESNAAAAESRDGSSALSDHQKNSAAAEQDGNNAALDFYNFHNSDAAAVDG